MVVSNAVSDRITVIEKPQRERKGPPALVSKMNPTCLNGMIQYSSDRMKIWIVLSKNS
jgi:hypothetical protein